MLCVLFSGGGTFRAKQLRHPAGVATTSCGSFVPNDISLGGEAPSFILLTGPNMGGKSTLLRQVCLAAVLAQVRGGGASGFSAMQWDCWLHVEPALHGPTLGW